MFEPQSYSILDIDHPQGPGDLIQDECNVEFNVIIPDNLETTPYYVLTAIGEHTHIPPPPSVVLGADVKDILKVLRPILTPGLTRCK